MLPAFENFTQRLEKSWWAVATLLAVGVAMKWPNLVQELPPFDFCDEGIFTRPAFDIYQGKGWLSSEFRAGQINIYLAVLANCLFSWLNPVESYRDFIQNARALSLVIMTPLTGWLLYRLVLIAGGSARQAYFIFVAFLFSPYVLGVGRWHYPDHYMPFFSVVFLLMLMHCYRSPMTRWRWTGLGIAWATITAAKYTGVFLALPVGALCWMKCGEEGPGILSARRWLRFIGYGIVLGFVFTLTFLLLNPGLAKFSHSFVEHFKFNHLNYSNPSERTFQNNYLFYLYLMWWAPFGLVGALFALIGIREALKSRFFLTAAIVAFLALLWLRLSTYEAVMSRTMMVCVPFILFFMSEGVRWLWDQKNLARAVKLGLMLLLFAEPLLRVASTLGGDLKIDGRILAQNWINEHLPPTSAIGETPLCGVPQVSGEHFRSAGITNADYFVENYWASPRAFSGRWTLLNTWNYLDLHFLTRGEMPLRRAEFLRFEESLKQFEVAQVFRGYGPEVILYRRLK